MAFTITISSGKINETRFHVRKFSCLPSQCVPSLASFNTFLEEACFLSKIIMLDRYGCVDFSPLMGMAYLCAFAASCTPIELSSHRRSEFKDLPFSYGKCQSRSEVPASVGKRSRGDSTLDPSVQDASNGTLRPPSACRVKTHACKSEEILSKRRKPSSRRESTGFFSPGFSTTPFDSFKK